MYLQAEENYLLTGVYTKANLASRWFRWSVVILYILTVTMNERTRNSKTFKCRNSKNWELISKVDRFKISYLDFSHFFSKLKMTNIYITVNEYTRPGEYFFMKAMNHDHKFTCIHAKILRQKCFSLIPSHVIINVSHAISQIDLSSIWTFQVLPDMPYELLGQQNMVDNYLA